MAMSAARADAVLPTGGHVQLHVGDPGAAGTGNVAQDDSESDAPRKAVTFDSPENHPTNVERRVLSTDAPEWDGTELEAAQEITHFSIWSAGSGGTVEHIAALTESKVVGSDGARFDTGDLEAAVGVYAKP